jgi:riboflavin synthase
MFTGIIEAQARVEDHVLQGENLSLWLFSSLTGSFKVDQSLSHNGACLTVEAIEGGRYKVSAVLETRQKTNIDSWKVGSKVNLERAMRVGDRLDGHWVQGHVDQVGELVEIHDEQGSWRLRFAYEPSLEAMIVEKGSICVNGISLTAFNTDGKTFDVAIIPYTWEHTNLSDLALGAKVNLEFDILGKYILKGHAFSAA